MDPRAQIPAAAPRRRRGFTLIEIMAVVLIIGLLSGIVGGLLAQHEAPVNAAVRGVCLHSAAADMVARQVGQRSMLATDLLPKVVSMLAAAEQ